MCSYERVGWLGSPDLARGFSKQDLETGLKFHIWTQGEIGPGNQAHPKRPVNLISFYHDNSLKTTAGYSEKRSPIQYGKLFFYKAHPELKICSY